MVKFRSIFYLNKYYITQDTMIKLEVLIERYQFLGRYDSYCRNYDHF